MNEKEIISGKQVINLMVLFIIGSTMIFSGYLQAQQDSWVAILLAVVWAIPTFLLYAHLSRLYPEKSFFDVFYIVFGKVGGCIATLLFIFYSFNLCAAVIRNFNELIKVVSFPETPKSVTCIFAGIICIYMLKQGIEVWSRLAVFTLPIVISVIIITCLLNLPDICIENIKPICAHNWKNIFSASFSSLSFPFAELVLFIPVINNMRKKDSPKKVFLTSLFIGAVLIVWGTVRNILVLGMPTLNNLYFPSYSALSIIDVEKFISRIEVLASANFIIAGIIKCGVCIYVTAKGIARIFNFDNYKHIIAPITLLILAFSECIFSSTMEMYDFVSIYKYFAFGFQFVLPLVLWITDLCKRHRKPSSAVPDKTIPQEI